MPGALLVADQDVADLRVEQRVVGGQDRAARDAEDDLDAHGLERPDEALRSGDARWPARRGRRRWGRRSRRRRGTRPPHGWRLRALAGSLGVVVISAFSWPCWVLAGRSGRATKNPSCHRHGGVSASVGDRRARRLRGCAGSRRAGGVGHAHTVRPARARASTSPSHTVDTGVHFRRPRCRSRRCDRSSEDEVSRGSMTPGQSAPALSVRMAVSSASGTGREMR